MVYNKALQIVQFASIVASICNCSLHSRRFNDRILPYPASCFPRTARVSSKNEITDKFRTKLIQSLDLVTLFEMLFLLFQVL